MTVTGDIAAAYSATGAAWQAGPARVYDRMAEVLVASSPVDLRGRSVLDIGAGTGAASRAIARAGGRPVACDLALGMLVAGRAGVGGPPAISADARALPLPDDAVGAAVAAFSFNHLPDPERALTEAARVVATGGAVLASAYAHDDDHPVKRAVEQAASQAGWRPEPWVAHLKRELVPRLADLDGARDAADRAGMGHAHVERVDVELTELQPADLVAWRLGMAQLAPFVARLTTAEREALEHRSLELLGDAPALVRRMVVIAAVVG